MAKNTKQPILDQTFIKQVEEAHFRTDCDTGSNQQAMLIWNCVREHVGLPRLKISDLPAYCATHKCYHIIRDGYGCIRAKH